MSHTPCALCGGDHNFPFDKDVIAFFMEIAEEKDRAARMAKVQNLGEIFEAMIDADDAGWPEDVHRIIEQLAEARLAVHQLESQLGRTAMRALADCIEDHAEQFPTPKDKKPKAPAVN
jgi:hypothetical protein